MKLIVAIVATLLLNVVLAYPNPDELQPEEAPASPEEPQKACACTMIHDPVCGANGVTYGNDCMRKCNDVRLLHKGECEDDLCVCTQEYEPVCGDDGTTYINDCSRECSGANLDHEGRC